LLIFSACSITLLPFSSLQSLQQDYATVYAAVNSCLLVNMWHTVNAFTKLNDDAFYNWQTNTRPCNVFVVLRRGRNSRTIIIIMVHTFAVISLCVRLCVCVYMQYDSIRNPWHRKFMFGTSSGTRNCMSSSYGPMKLIRSSWRLHEQKQQARGWLAFDLKTVLFNIYKRWFTFLFTIIWSGIHYWLWGYWMRGYADVVASLSYLCVLFNCEQYHWRTCLFWLRNVH